jgi:molybdopterin-guanine dinucleotide biosynthesis protein B
MRPAIFGIYGKSKTGKTSLIIKIINTLTKDGIRIACIKKSNKIIDIDTKGKDTCKYTEAGSKIIVLSSKNNTDILLKKRQDIEEIIDQICYINKYNLIIIEGANESYIPKIRLGNIEKRENTILTYSNDFPGLIKIIKKEINRRNKMEDIKIKVNGKNIPLTEFPTEMIKNTICGMLTSLKGVEKIRTVEIKFEL